MKSSHPDYKILKCLLGRFHEHNGDLDARNAMALQLFTYGPKIVVNKDRTEQVETWWDRRTASWITQKVSLPSAVQIGGAEYSGNRADAAVAHFWAVAELLMGPSSPDPTEPPDPNNLFDIKGFEACVPAIVLEDCPTWLVAQFLKAVANPSNYGVAWAMDETECLPGPEWLADNS
jgi:hypothetical protein